MSKFFELIEENFMSEKFREIHASKEIWNNSKNGIWMYDIGKNLADLRNVISIAGYCAQTVIKYVENKDCLMSIQAAIDFHKGIVPIETLKSINKKASNVITCLYREWFKNQTDEGKVIICAHEAAAFCSDLDIRTSANVPLLTSEVFQFNEELRLKNIAETAEICKKYFTKDVFNAIERRIQ